MQLNALMYDALDNSSSALLLSRLNECKQRGRETAKLYTSFGGIVWVPDWMIVCCLAEREEDEAELNG